MNDDIVARDPRHSSTGIVVEVRLSPGGPADAIRAELVNLSRSGFQLRLPKALGNQETVVMRIVVPERNVDVIFPATVRWTRREEDGWLAGCKTNWHLDLETLGELFLCEVLAMDEPSPAEYS